MDSCIPQYIVHGLQASVLYNGLHKWRLYNVLLIGHEDNQVLDDSQVRCCPTSSTVTISGCREDVCFAIDCELS